MPKKPDMGDDTYTLLEYLFGPGKRDEHTDPHLVAAWDPDVPCPVRQPERIGLGELADLLDAPVQALRGAPAPARVARLGPQRARRPCPVGCGVGGGGGGDGGRGGHRPGR